ncbi:DUF2249 domain-containing protein [Aestuariirhabdus sp. Z084]|uniref:DUF2249 domain-containing protein n=1 Tax=Aestuariirhabdus haliotis TaxID=2918751 RepID=UPI00201B461C|nr:DUF2249 domain-containing protein [Aestuariirhabdus haliotis]MCL6415827.1 DUF2249 domain-containing protein [Aestuariirhabdus haliotis]MCL6419871.1 DUF2249 domain-containing protein [Aestuariirhabdus haliotis]
MSAILLDLSELEPPQPWERIVEQLPRLNQGDWLQVWHHREPRPLWALLNRLGLSYCCLEIARLSSAQQDHLPCPPPLAQYWILIWNPHDQPSSQTCQKLIEL